jgi:hypothetical protein
MRKKKLPAEKKPKFTCTPEQENAATKFLRRILEINKIIGPTMYGSGCDDLLTQMNEEYHHTVLQLLRTQKRFDYLEKKDQGPFGSATVSEKAGLLINAKDIFRNGPLRKQAQSEDYLFATTDLGAIAYEVAETGKSCATLKVYFGAIHDGDSESSRYFQLIDIHEAPTWRGAFRCDYCAGMVDQLYVSAVAEHFGCVACHTTLDARELNTYERTVKMLQGRKRGAA